VQVRVNGFVWLFDELKARFKGPIGHTAAWGFLLFGAFGLGGAGIWYEVWPFIFGGSRASVANVHTAMLTYFLALAGSAALQLIFADVEKPLRVFGVTAAFLFVGLAVWLDAVKPEDDAQAFILATVGSVLALVMWWLTAGQDDGLKDNIKITPDAAVGGDPKQQPQGDLTGFKS
jgi:hypothetical protein